MDYIDQVRNVLVHVWDPLMVSNQPECHDEYDFCLGRIYRLAFEDNATAVQIREFMVELLRNEVGLICDPEMAAVSLTAAEEIVKIRDNG
jgi:hypothetical protein